MDGEEPKKGDFFLSLHLNVQTMSQLIWIKMANLVFELEKKLASQLPSPLSSPGIKRNIDKMKTVLEEAGLLSLNPAGERYTETRTDLEASITGAEAGDLVVLDVIKPVIYSDQGGARTLIQKGVVIVGNK